MNKDIFSLICFYKYSVFSPVITRNVSHLYNSLKEKKEEFLNKKLELHISPFYEEKNGDLYWQPIFDFDNIFYFDKFKKYILYDENKNDWFIEITDTYFHLVSKNAFGPVKKDEIFKIRLKFKYFSNFGIDVSSSIRHLPIKRSLSQINSGKYISTPVELKNFSIKHITKKENLSEEQFYNILSVYIFPHKLKSLNALSFFRRNFLNV